MSGGFGVDLAGRESLDCEVVVRSLWAYLDGETSEGDARALERHLARCESCRAHADFEARLVAELVRLRRTHSDPVRLRMRVLEALCAAGLPGAGIEPGSSDGA
jgi:anti-sigma factor (TIGR02949 family)